jgi:hypothetical protein
MNRATTVAPLSHYNANYPAQTLPAGLAQKLKPLEPMALRLPGADRPWRHALAQWQAALCSLVREHRLQPERARPYTAEVTLTEDLFVRWQRALDIPAAAAAGMSAGDVSVSASALATAASTSRVGRVSVVQSVITAIARAAPVPAPAENPAVS